MQHRPFFEFKLKKSQRLDFSLLKFLNKSEESANLFCFMGSFGMQFSGGLKGISISSADAGCAASCIFSISLQMAVLLLFK